MNRADPPGESPVQVAHVSLHHGETGALHDVCVEFAAGELTGLIGPDGVGKSTLMSLIAGVHELQSGTVRVLGGDMRQRNHRERVLPLIAYMPQGLGKNLYPSLSIEENLQFFGRLFGQSASERRQRIDALTALTGLSPFLGRPVGNLSGGMKQKVGLCSALIHDPELLILDEPTTGVDPLSRSQFWDLIARMRQARPDMSVIVATAYMEEAEHFDRLIVMDQGRILRSGSCAELLAVTGATSMEDAFIALLPQDKRPLRGGPRPPRPRPTSAHEPVAIEARGLTRRFGEFVAVDHVDFRITQGEIFGFLGSNGCGKTTTMKLLTGLLEATEGSANLFGQIVDPKDLSARRRVGYMSQGFSLYSELTVRQNLVLHARLFRVPEPDIAQRVEEMTSRFGLDGLADRLPDSLPLGIRQRLSMAVAMVHQPDMLILDEPTSGVDPVARDMLWELMVGLSRDDNVTIFISTHFMNEAMRCDRVSLMHAGKVLVTDTPAAIIRRRDADSLESAFIAYLVDASAGDGLGRSAGMGDLKAKLPGPGATAPSRGWRLSLRRIYSYMLREALELKRDPLRATLALAGTAILMFIIGYGISFDVENLTYAVLDHDQTTISRRYNLNLSGSRYFIEHAPLVDYADLDARMRSGELSLAMEIPPGFARDIARGAPVEIGTWVNGSMPTRAETIRGYIEAMHRSWLVDEAVHRLGIEARPASEIVIRYRYNPNVRSLDAMAPAVIPLLLMMIPAMLAALSVVREKELGSIVNLYVTPITRAEFLLGKQLPYLALGMVNFLIMTILAITAFGVPLKGDFATLFAAAFLYVGCSTGMGLLVSTFTRSQIAAIFLAMIGTIIPCIQFSGLINPVSSLEGVGAAIGAVYPASHFLTISRGVFNKGLGLGDLSSSVWPLLVAAPLIYGLAWALLHKQDRS